MRKLITLFCFLAFGFTNAQVNKDSDIKAINKVLKKQRIAWSNNDIEGYMEGYWQSDSLAFYGNKGVIYGWENTLDHYLTYYPTAAYTGKLSFKINAVNNIAPDSYYVLGEYHIKREVGNADGLFMLVFKKIDGKWKIIADTSV
ncbi:nuclear transport factor 2 family protein [Hyunsoonleella flava]|uniref:Nuclear transport factor 2 family protein n=1 Tax=Hyunsoonleella flava TaxID=2527939 RepID=A0A4Q9FKC4_9FLAO|nr:nuclear transport factor 2 family protein [Hyunsoonleella flava]TBN05315.1 nuclear transport factor 2 family protein [Hyunsoonleella flava]